MPSRLELARDSLMAIIDKLKVDLLLHLYDLVFGPIQLPCPRIGMYDSSVHLSGLLAQFRPPDGDNYPA